MDAVTFHPARLVRRWQEAEDLEGLRVAVPRAVADSYLVPGQYVQARVAGEEGAFLAIASPPGATELEFLIKRSPAADALLALHPDDALEVTAAQGKGYPVAAHIGHDVLLFAVGAGISPIRALIGYLADHREAYEGVTLFYGARTFAHVPYHDEVSAWQRAGIQVVRVLSQPLAVAPGFAPGYVQEALREHPVRPGRTVAFVCGMRAMVEAVVAELGRRGVPAERVFQNF